MIMIKDIDINKGNDNDNNDDDNNKRKLFHDNKANYKILYNLFRLKNYSVKTLLTIPFD